jgi:hypothetical protein
VHCWSVTASAVTSSAQQVHDAFERYRSAYRVGADRHPGSPAQLRLVRARVELVRALLADGTELPSALSEQHARDLDWLDNGGHGA